MQKSTKNIFFFGGALALLASLVVIPGSKLLKFKNSASFNINGLKSFDIINANLLQLPPNLGECRFRFDLDIDNPINDEFKVTVPYIRAYVGSSQLGNSIPRTEPVVIKASQRTTITNIDFRIPTRNLQTVLNFNLDTVRAMIASRSLSLNRQVRFVIGLTINGVNATVEQIVTL